MEAGCKFNVKLSKLIDKHLINLLMNDVNRCQNKFVKEHRKKFNITPKSKKFFELLYKKMSPQEFAVQIVNLLGFVPQ